MANTPTQLQELQLRVALNDEATAGLKKFREELGGLTDELGKEAAGKLKEEMKELGDQIKELAELSKGGGDALVKYIGKFGAAGAAMGGFTAAIVIGLESLKEFSTKWSDLATKAQVIGVDPATMKTIIEQYERAGVSADVTQKSIAGFADALADLGKVGSEKRMEMIREAGAFGEAMDQNIAKILSQGSFEKKMQEAVVVSWNVYDQKLKETGDKVKAAAAQRKFLELVNLDPSLKLLKNLEEASEEEKKATAERIKRAQEFQNQIVTLGQEWEKFTDSMLASALAPDGVIVKGLTQMVALVKEMHEIWLSTWASPEVKKNIEDAIHPKKDEKEPKPQEPKPQEPKPETGEQPQAAPTPPVQAPAPTSTAPAKQSWGDWFHHRMEKLSGPESSPLGLLSESDKANATAADGKDFFSTPGFSKDWSWMRKSEDIEDRRDLDESMSQGEDYIKTIDENTVQVKKMNENFKLLDQGQVELKGLGGLPGFEEGGGGGGRYGGGGATGGWTEAPNGSSVGPGSGSGANESKPSETGGGTPAGKDDSSAPTVASGAGTDEIGPKAALAIARQHLNEDEIRDEGKLSAFFATKGIKISPRTTAWCAAFVNTTLGQAGVKGTGSLAAASFYKYGSAVKDGAQAGDIAVWPHHVAMLTGETRTGPGGQQQFQVIGGNQGGTVSGQGGVTYSWRNYSGATFRRPDWDEAKGQAKSQDDRAAVDASDAKQVRTVKVDVSGKLTADVNAPRGSDVKVEGDGAFKKTETNRTMPMENAN
jgi:hypothetical protein